MGESKRRQIEQSAERLTKDLMDKGKLIEAGFAVFSYFVIPRDAPDIQVEEMQMAYMAGAEHLWSSVMSSLDPGDEPSDTDLRRLDLVQHEIDEWRARISERVDPVKGNT